VGPRPCTARHGVISVFVQNCWRQQPAGQLRHARAPVGMMRERRSAHQQARCGKRVRRAARAAAARAGRQRLGRGPERGVRQRRRRPRGAADALRHLPHAAGAGLHVQRGAVRQGAAGAQEVRPDLCSSTRRLLRTGTGRLLAQRVLIYTGSAVWELSWEGARTGCAQGPARSPVWERSAGRASRTLWALNRRAGSPSAV